MPDFSHLYQRPAGRTPEQKLLPIETYPGIVKSYSLEELNRQSGKVAGVRVNVALTGWAESIQEEDRMQEGPDGKQTPIDITRRSFRQDFATPDDFTDQSWYYLDEFLRSCGLDTDGGNYEELFPQLVGQRVLVTVGWYNNQRTGKITNVCQGLVGTARS